MRHNNIRGLIKIPGYKIKEDIEKRVAEIHIRIETHKRNRGICSGCCQKHGGLHSEQEMVAEDVRLGERRVFLGSFVNNLVRLIKSFGK